VQNDTSAGRDFLGDLLSGGTLIQEEKALPPLQEKKPKVIILAGPTGSGKSTLGALLAEEMGGEIVSADSVQVYRGLDIGTAKATKQERARVPHHLLDVRHVTDFFNVVDFYYEARHAIQTILGYGGVPIVVGGSGFYIHALLYGPPSGPSSIPEVRQRLEKQMERVGADEMYQRLAQLDIAYANTITCHDKHKIVRALEIIEITGEKVSRLSWKNRLHPKHYDFRCWFLNRPKGILYKRIEKRCDKMLAHGLLEETARLEKEGLLENPSACQAIGYRQSLDFLHGPQTREDYLSFVDLFKQQSRRYAKRQLTWFRREPMFQWIDLDLHDPETVIDLIINDHRS